MRNPGLVIQPPVLMRKIYPDAVYRIRNDEKKVFLTFDDGPIPEVTPWLTDLLEAYSVKSTFFCVGENVKKYPDVYNLLSNRGHRVGNHTYNHLRGLKTPNDVFLLNVERASALIDSDLFRPPHGLMTIGQYKNLKKKFRIILWDVLSCDTRHGIDPEEVLRNVLGHVRSGSVITFHDSLKSSNILKEVLSVMIEKLKEEGYSFHPIE